MARSSAYIRRPWCIDRRRNTSRRSDTGWRYLVVMVGSHRMPEAQSFNDAMKLARTLTKELER